MNDLMTKSFVSYVELKKQAMLIDLEACNGPGLASTQRGGEEEAEQVEERDLAHFFEEVGAIQLEMHDVSGLLLELRHLTQETRTTHSGKALRGLRDRMDSAVAAVLRKAHTIKARLGVLDRSNAAARRRPSSGPADRTRASVTNGLRSKLREMMNEFQSLREQIVAEYRDVLKMRYFNATGQVPGEEMMEKLLVSGEGTLVGDVEEGRERHTAVSELQRSLTKLHRVFLDMAVLVEAQGEQLNDIEENVGRAGVYISGGTGGLAAARAMKEKARRNWACGLWGAMVLTLLLLTCLIPIFTGS